MVLKNRLIYIAIIIAAVVIAGIFFNMKMDFLSSRGEVIRIFPGIIGDMLLKNNETGINFIRSITLHDDFRGNITQGYKATYSGSNGTMIIFMAQMQDNVTANISLKDMVIRAGFNESVYNESEIPIIGRNISIAKLPVKDPEVFAIKKNINATLHYVFFKKDKVYWVGFSNDQDIEYQLGMLVEIYRRIDWVKGDFGSFDYG